VEELQAATEDVRFMLPEVIRRAMAGAG
jgi:hypothetical protein